MTKSELIAELSQRAALTKSVAAAVLDHLADIAAAQLANDGGELTLPRIVKLTRKQRAARVSRNPQTGAPIDVPAKVVVVAKPVGDLKAISA